MLVQAAAGYYTQVLSNDQGEATDEQLDVKGFANIIRVRQVGMQSCTHACCADSDGCREWLRAGVGGHLPCTCIMHVHQVCDYWQLGHVFEQY